MIFAAFFPGADGQFDYKLLLVSLLLLFLGGTGVVWIVPLALRTGKTQWVRYSSSAGRHIRHIYERDKNPAAYWIVCAVQFIGSLLAVMGFVAIMFGWERTSH